MSEEVRTSETVPKTSVPVKETSTEKSHAYSNDQSETTISEGQTRGYLPMNETRIQNDETSFPSSEASIRKYDSVISSSSHIKSETVIDDGKTSGEINETRLATTSSEVDETSNPLSETSTRKDDSRTRSSSRNEPKTVITDSKTCGQINETSVLTNETSSQIDEAASYAPRAQGKLDETLNETNETHSPKNETAELAGETIIYLRVTPGEEEETARCMSEGDGQSELPTKHRAKNMDEILSHGNDQSSPNSTTSAIDKETPSQHRQRSDGFSQTEASAPCVSDTSSGQDDTAISKETQTRAQTEHTSTTPTTTKCSTSALLDNIAESSRCLIRHIDPSLHVITHAERTALKILKQHGSVLLTGKSGSGKSSIGYRLLREMEQEDNRMPLVLTSYRQWHHIPQNRQSNRYVVFIDDIFGCSSFVESQLENWGKLFLLMYPAVESGHIMLVLSSRTEIYARCENRLRNYAILRNIQHMYLDGHEYRLRKKEKMKFIRMYLKNIADLQKIDIDRLTTLDPPLGFPQCCVFFAQNKSVQERGEEFFEKPREFIADDIWTLKEKDPVGYLVLVLVIMMKNSLDTRLLTKPSSEFREMIQELANSCISVCRPPSCAQIREKVDLLSDAYLSESNNVVRFQHQSVFDAVIVNAAHENQELLLQYFSAEVLLDFVSIQSRENVTVICVEDDMYPALARRLTDLMLTGDTTIILDHPCLQDLKFVQTLNHIWTEEMVSKLTRHEILQENVRLWAYFDNGHTLANESLRKNTETKIFSYKTIVSLLIMKRLDALAKLLIPMVPKRSDLDENLVCAVFMQQLELVMMLLDRGASFNDVTLITACCTTPTSRDATDTVFIANTQFIEQPDRKLSLAVQHGNIFAVQHLVQYILKRDRKTDIFTDCLFQLVDQCAVSGLCVPIIPSGSIPVVEILQLLLSASGFDLVEQLIPAAARHEESSCLKYLLDFTEENSMVGQLSEALHGSSMFGTAESIMLLLQKGAFNRKAIIAAAQSQESRTEKLKILLDTLYQNAILNEHEDMTIEHLVNLEEDGFVPLHFAVAYGKTEDVTLLLDSGADMNFTSDSCFAPYQLAAFTCNTETLLPFLNIIKKQNNKFSLPMTHFVVANSLQCLSSTNMQEKLLRKILSGVSKPARKQKKITELLVNHGIDINEVDEDGKSAIFIAAAVGSTGMVKYLHTGGAKIDVVDKAGRTVLHEVVKHGDLEMVEYLCEQGSDVNVKDTAGFSVLQEAAMSGVDAFEKLKYLIDFRKASIDDAKSVICDSIPSDNIEIVEYLVSEIVSEEQFNGMKNAVFFDACRFHSHAILDYTVKTCHVDVNMKTDSLQHILKGNTGIHFAVQHLSTRSDDIVQCLLQNGADVDAKDKDGNTALLFSLQTLKKKSDEKIEEADNTLYLMHLKMIKVLAEKHANVNVRDPHGNTPLHAASQIRHPTSVDLVKLLLDKGADKNAEGGFGNTPLHYAVRNEGPMNYALIEEFIDRGSNVNARNSNGKTPVAILLDRFDSSSGSKRAELGKLKIIFDRCSHMEGYNRDVLAFGLYANYLR